MLSCFGLELTAQSLHFFNVQLQTKRFYDLLANVYVAFFGSVASIAGLIWFAFDKLQPSAIVWSALVLVALIFLSAISIYSIRVRQENIQFRQFIKILHRINHDYRDMLSAAFKHQPHEFTGSEYSDFLKKSEKDTIRSVCQKIAKVYTAFTHSDCTVTVKLITRVSEKIVCETHERSEEKCARDTQQKLFEINTGANTAFDKALMYADGAVSHFHSSDLTKDSSYRNQRDHWSDFYKSTIVVPIRSVDLAKLGSKNASSDIGFLCVDTLSPNRLNNTWHHELLAAFADQMYNFMSLMRGEYQLKSTPSINTTHSESPRVVTL